ncbi:MAG: hypothetical protein PHU81_07880 [Acidobacteriota bacterium]|nr:hypothetical protein [Acidobacteriota bacterium]
MTPNEEIHKKEKELQKLLSLPWRTAIDYQRIASLSAELSQQKKGVWENKDRAELTALLAQYESLRKESLQTITNRVQTMLLGIAAIGALVGGTLTIEDPQLSRDIIYAVFSGAIPLVSVFILFVWISEALRSARVGYFLAADVESRINQKLGSFTMNWETGLWAGLQKRDEVWGPSMMAMMILGIISAASPWCGLLLVGEKNPTLCRVAFLVGIPYLFLIVVAACLFPKMKQLRNNPTLHSVFLKEPAPQEKSNRVK